MGGSVGVRIAGTIMGSPVRLLTIHILEMLVHLPAGPKQGNQEAPYKAVKKISQ